GTAASNSFSNGFYLSADATITGTVLFLDGDCIRALAVSAAQACAGPMLTIPSTVAPGNYFIGILVDRTNGTAESNEGNNFKSTPLTVTVPQPELIVASLNHAPANPTTADLIRFTAVVGNAGSATAGASTLESRIGR